MAIAVASTGFAVGAALATLAGGALALRMAGRLPLLLGLAAGIVLGVALFDLLPEALTLGEPGRDLRSPFSWLAAGLMGYMLIDRTLHHSPIADRWRVHLAPGALTLHSFTDGFGIGVAYQVDPRLGLLVGFAVLTHDVADGINTVSLGMMAGDRRAARMWLAIDAAAPLAGVVVAMQIRVPQDAMARMLAVFAGIFLYIGACQLVPRARSLDQHPRIVIASAAGLAAMFAVTAGLR